MNQDVIKNIGKNQTKREGALLFRVNEVEGLVDIFDKDFSKWSDFDFWTNIGLQQWFFSRAMDVYHGKKLDIKCECCESIGFNQFEINNMSSQKCYGKKSVYMIKKVLEEIVLAKKSRESDGTYSA